MNCIGLICFFFDLSNGLAVSEVSLKPPQLHARRGYPPGSAISTSGHQHISRLTNCPRYVKIMATVVMVTRPHGLRAKVNIGSASHTVSEVIQQALSDRQILGFGFLMAQKFDWSDRLMHCSYITKMAIITNSVKVAICFKRYFSALRNGQINQRYLRL